MKKKQPAQQSPSAGKNLRITPFAVILFFIILGIIGISLDEPSRILNQATQICLSCIGIG
ncbi:MAG: hypothetical protein MI862_07530 [Desulfobacterales bacterium]|nr:hypothetical protein [Desulfobacterales bacterium]